MPTAGCAYAVEIGFNFTPKHRPNEHANRPIFLNNSLTIDDIYILFFTSAVDRTKNFQFDNSVSKTNAI